MDNLILAKSYAHYVGLCITYRFHKPIFIREYKDILGRKNAVLYYNELSRHNPAFDKIMESIKNNPNNINLYYLSKYN